MCAGWAGFLGIKPVAIAPKSAPGGTTTTTTTANYTHTFIRDNLPINNVRAKCWCDRLGSRLKATPMPDTNRSINRHTHTHTQRARARTCTRALIADSMCARVRSCVFGYICFDMFCRLDCAIRVRARPDLAGFCELSKELVCRAVRGIMGARTRDMHV